MIIPFEAFFFLISVPAGDIFKNPFVPPIFWNACCSRYHDIIFIVSNLFSQITRNVGRRKNRIMHTFVRQKKKVPDSGNPLTKKKKSL